MVIKSRLLVMSLAVVGVLTITHLTAACIYDASKGQGQPSTDAKGESSQVTQEPTVMSVSPITSTTIVTADVPIDYGPFRIIPSNHPEARESEKKSTGPWPPPPVTTTKTVSDTRKHIPSFKEPGYLP